MHLWTRHCASDFPNAVFTQLAVSAQTFVIVSASQGSGQRSQSSNAHLGSGEPEFGPGSCCDSLHAVSWDS